jgi:hypothetical protein
MTKQRKFVRLLNYDVGVLILANGSYVVVSINLN